MIVPVGATVSYRIVSVTIADSFSPGGMTFNVVTFLLVMFFAFFYASIAFNAKVFD